MRTLYERLIEICRDQGIENPRPKDISEICGISSGRPKQIKDAGEAARLGADSLARLVAMRYSPKWIQEGRGAKFMADEHRSETDPGPSRLPIRRALFKLSAGVSGYEIEYENGESEPIFMAKRWFDRNHYNPDKLVALHIHGRSMEPKMYDGDLVIINTENHTPKDGVVFAVNYEGEMVIKRMKRDAGQWFITSDNPDKVRFGDKVCAEGCFVLGEVVYLQTEQI